RRGSVLQGHESYFQLLLANLRPMLRTCRSASEKTAQESKQPRRFWLKNRRQVRKARRRRLPVHPRKWNNPTVSLPELCSEVVLARSKILRSLAQEVFQESVSLILAAKLGARAPPNRCAVE